MRTAFIEQLVLEARTNPRIFLVVGDLGYSVVEAFAREFPSRFLNAGVAEQNMTGLAAGLASEGYHVFTYSIANFPTFRCAEQIRNDIAYHNLPVTVVSVGGGLAYGPLGYSHHAVQDLALLRSFPSVLIAAPGDPAETRSCLAYLSGHPQPSYLRLGKAGEPRVHGTDPTVQPGKIVHVAGDPNARRVVLTTGATLKLASDAFADGRVRGWKIASLPLWSAASKFETAAVLSGYETIVTVEDHLRGGGFGSYVQELLGDADSSAKVRCIALSSDVCDRVGSQSSLNQFGGVTAESIVATCLRN
jgi:transketolase